MHSPKVAPAPAADEAQRKDSELLEQLRGALATCSRLLDDLQAGRIDAEFFHAHAFRAGLIVRDGEAWMWDFFNGWYRYDEITLKHLPLPTERTT
jgi:hypothetical protein